MSLTVEKCIEGWTNTLTQLNVKADIVFFGDSLIYYGVFASLFPNKVVCNLGLRGDTIQGLITRIEQVLILEPGVIYMMAGINDIAELTIEKFEVYYSKLIYEIKLNLPAANLIILSILPVNNTCFNISCNNEQIKAFNQALSRLHLRIRYLLRIYILYLLRMENCLVS